jgi:hypothetical protein
MSLTRDQILQAQDIQTEEVEIPEWGGSVFVRGMTGTERDAFENSIVETRGKSTRVNMRNIRAKLVAQSACDESGKPLFTPRDIDALGEKSAAALQRVFDVASRLSGISGKDVEELAEGLDESPFAGSPSG